VAESAAAMRERGFSLVEVLIALLITMSVMAGVFLLLQRGQSTFKREPEIADMNAAARTGLDLISRDLALAGYYTPPNMAVMWSDGGGIAPDTISILYADPNFPISRPKPCAGVGGGGRGGGGGPCNTIGSSATLNLDPYSFSPQPSDYEDAYHNGMVLHAIQGPNGSPACDTAAPAIIPFEVTQPPKCTGAGGANSGPAGCATLNVNHSPGVGSTELNLPQGFNNDVSVDCAVIGFFHVIQYRVNPLPPAANPSLERRDVALDELWGAVSANIENLQFQYAQGSGGNFQDVPALSPTGSDQNTWVTEVRVTVAGRSWSRNLEGSTAGVFASGDTYLRRTFSTTMALGNQLSYAQQKAFELGVAGWN
jgi:hypothetical protein